MTLIGWLLLAEVITAIVLVVWFINRAHQQVKRSPAEQALIKHLAELEQDKSQSENKSSDTPKSQPDSSDEEVK